MKRVVQADANGSDIAFIKRRSVLLVDDDIGLVRQRLKLLGKGFKGDAKYAMDPGLAKLFRDLEGLHYNRERDRLWILDEKGEDGGATINRLDNVKGRSPTCGVEACTQLSVQPISSSKKNGFEGIAEVPFVGGYDLALCHQKDPAAIVFFDSDWGGQTDPILIDGLSDINGIRFRELDVNPDNGNLVLLTNKPSMIVELKMGRNEYGEPTLELDRSVSLEDIVEQYDAEGGKVKFEGITFDHRGDVWVSDDEGGLIYELDY